jgi:hypothetical protein
MHFADFGDTWPLSTARVVSRCMYPRDVTLRSDRPSPRNRNCGNRLPANGLARKQIALGLVTLRDVDPIGTKEIECSSDSRPGAHG